MVVLPFIPIGPSVSHVHLIVWQINFLLMQIEVERTKKTFEPNGALDSATPKPKSHECETCIMRYYTLCPREFIGKTV